jgi:hypothetical protein
LLIILLNLLDVVVQLAVLACPNKFIICETKVALALTTVASLALQAASTVGAGGVGAWSLLEVGHDINFMLEQLFLRSVKADQTLVATTLAASPVTVTAVLELPMVTALAAVTRDADLLTPPTVVASVSKAVDKAVSA